MQQFHEDKLPVSASQLTDLGNTSTDDFDSPLLEILLRSAFGVHF